MTHLYYSRRVQRSERSSFSIGRCPALAGRHWPLRISSSNCQMRATRPLHKRLARETNEWLLDHKKKHRSHPHRCCSANYKLAMCLCNGCCARRTFLSISDFLLSDCVRLSSLSKRCRYTRSKAVDEHQLHELSPQSFLVSLLISILFFFFFSFVTRELFRSFVLIIILRSSTRHA